MSPRRRSFVPYCRGCGRNDKRLRWPIGDASFCNKDCAARMALILVEGSPDTGYCRVCGELNCNTDHDRRYDAEGDLFEAQS